MTTENFPSRLLRRVSARLLTAGLLCLPVAAFGANYCQKNDLIIEMGRLEISGAADSNFIGAEIGNIAQGAHPTVFAPWPEHEPNVAYCRPVISWAKVANDMVPGLEYVAGDGLRYSVFRTDIPGIGYIIGISDNRDNAEFIPMIGIEDVKTFEKAANSNPKTIGYRAKIQFVATGRLLTGEYSLVNFKAVDFSARVQFNNAIEIGASVRVNATVVVNALSCTITNGSNRRMVLPHVPLAMLRNVPVGSSLGNDAFRSEEISIGVKCPPGVSLYASLGDANNPGSTENYLSIATGEYMAKGLGVALYQGVGDASPINRVTFYPESFSNNNPNAIFLGKNTSDSEESYQLKLQAEYVRLENAMFSGSLEAAATVTFAYR